MAGGGAWGFAAMQPTQPLSGQAQNYEAMFNSLFPVNGMVTGARDHVQCMYIVSSSVHGQVACQRVYSGTVCGHARDSLIKVS